ncbi:MAG: ATP phosphoribosyltransferase [Dehalococcoidales bacterium]
MGITVPVRIALPKGRMLEDTAAVLKRADWKLAGYTPSLRNYRLKSGRFSDLEAKVFNERDVPVQVAIGNYDLGICGLDWVEELSVKYPSASVVKLKDLGYATATLYLASSRALPAPSLEELRAHDGLVRIASEYPNLAEYLALQLRLRRFSVFPLWGSAGAYPPENATFALVSCRSEEELAASGLVAARTLLRHSACLIANRVSWERKDLSRILASLDDNLPARAGAVAPTPADGPTDSGTPWETDGDTVRLALPDGHQRQPTAALLAKAGIRVDDYRSPTGNRRPGIDREGVVIKVIRPQDMPLQVANSNFDLAITGRDWLTDHRITFPSSPATHLVDLRSAKVRMVAVIARDVPADDVFSLRQLVAERTEPFRVASEYVGIADKYARDNHLGFYKVIPTWGATEAFLPEDADMLIENTETGSTITRHNLKIIDTLFESTGCLIGNRDAVASPVKKQRIDAIAETLRAAVEGN